MKTPLDQRFLFFAGLAATGLLASCSGGGGIDTSIALPPITGGFGDFAFEVRQDVNVGGSLLTGTLFQDFNGDGLMDIAELSNATNLLHIGRGLADGTFLEVGVLPTLALPWSIASGDFDGDGTVDLAVGCLTDSSPSKLTSGGSLLFYRQDEFGDFILTSTTPLIGQPLSMTRLWEGGSDLDAVGKDDLLVGLRGAGVVQQLRMESGSWTLMTQLDSTAAGLAAASPMTVTTMDMDGDSDLDVIVGEFEVVAEPHRVVAYENDGLGGFFPAVVVLPFLDSPIVAGQGDVDGDGFEDLSISELGGTEAILLHGSPAGLLVMNSADFGGPVSGAVWGDFDEDGIFDVAAMRVNDQAVGVRYGIASGTGSAVPGMSFEEPTFYNVGSGPHDLTMVHLPQDGRVDLVCANAGDVSILHNLGNRSFLAAHGTYVGNQPSRIVTADLDQNGTVDVVTFDTYQKSAVFLSGQGDGTFVRTAEVPMELSGTATPGHAVIRDFDEDGLIDVLVSTFEAGDVRLMRNPGSLVFGAPSISDMTSVGTHPLGLDSADFNGDGHWDVLVANSDDFTIQLLLGVGDGTFTTQAPMALGARTMAVYTGDISGDGNPDAVVTMANPDNSNPRIKLFEGNGSGGLIEKASFPLGNVSATIQVGDLDADGLIDIVFGQSTVFTDEVTILMNQGLFAFSASTLIVGDDPGSLNIADVDGDGDLDLVVPVGAGELRLALGDGTGAFPEVVPLEGSEFSLPVPFGTNSSDFADLNGDGLADLLMMSPNTSFLWVAKNLGDGGAN